jgi:Protein of unknown function (DUF3006)
MAIAATIDRFEDDKAVVLLDNGQELVLSRSELPAGVGEGARLVLRFTHDEADEADKAEQARQLLTDLLQRKS